MSSRHSTLHIESLAYGGDGVGHLDGRVVFVAGTVPGDTVVVDIIEDKGTFYRARLVAIETPSPERMAPVCPVFDLCGGCQWQMINYPEQCRWKTAAVRESLRRIGGVETDVEDCIPAPATEGWRTSVRFQASVTRTGHLLGFNERRSHRVVDIDACPVATDGVNEIFGEVKSLLGGHTPLAISEIDIRSSYAMDSALVAIETRSRADLAAASDMLMERLPRLAGVSHIAGGRLAGRRGRRWREEFVAGNRFHVSEDSFFQVNTPQAERMAALVRDMLDTRDGDVVVDGYGGVGLFSVCSVAQGAVVHLYDLSSDAVKDAVRNAEAANFERFTAHRADTVEACAAIGSADHIIVDPPRTGLGVTAVEALSSLGARRVVYVSCNPATLARDLAFFTERGYAVRRVAPVDMFPHTYHVESVVLLER